MRTRAITVLAVVAFCGASALSQVPDGGELANLRYGAWGVDLSARDLSVSPGEDFDRYAGGAWADRTPIPADGSYAGPYDDLERLSQRRLAAIIRASGPDTPVGALYRGFLDEARVEQAGTNPIRQRLRTLAAVSSHVDLARWLGAGAKFAGTQPFELGTGPALNDPEQTVIDVGQGGIGLPDRDYYILDRFSAGRAAYREYVRRLLALTGSSQPAADAEAVLSLEDAIARAHYGRADARDPAKSLRSAHLRDLIEEAPAFPWTTWLEAAGMPAASDTPMVILQDRAVREEAEIWRRSPLATLKAWSAFHLADDAAPYLSSAFVDAHFKLDGSLKGLVAQPTREKRAILLVDSLLGDDVGRYYVRRFFTKADKLAAERVVANVKAALRRRLATNSWLAPETRTTALLKLDRTTVRLGWPERWRDHATLKLHVDDLLGNVEAIRASDWARMLAEIGKPMDRRRWRISPQTVNAYNAGQMRMIVLPAARLQPPNFARSADAAANYGALGALAGHELSHSFDNRGRLADPDGRIRDWWTSKDVAAFEARTDVIGRQFAEYEPLPGVHLNPRLTMGENIADLVGLEAALDAYHTSLRGKPAPVIDGLTGDQRFFLAYAQSRREKQRDEDLRDLASRDSHAPGRFRVIGPLRNIDAWYDAFRVRPGDRYYLAPADRARVW